MCTNTREIINKYTAKTIRVKCGRCPACLMEKAIRNCDKIKSQYNPDSICWFVTLTYNNDSCPYILEDDLNEFHPTTSCYSGSSILYPDSYEVPVYRDCDTRRVRFNKEYSIYSRRKKGTHVIGSTFLPSPLPFQNYQYLRNQSEKKIGVLFYKDVQNFLKRLRINLQRHFSYEELFKVFYIGEYGETYLRPHFHLLIFTKPTAQSFFKSAVATSWQFADYYENTRFCEISKGAASYVSSYINGNIYLPQILRDSSTHSPKTCHSIHFGFGNEIFSFENVSKMVNRRTVEYTVQRVTEHGKTELVSIPLPRYVISRYAPKIKGYSRLTRDEICDIYQNPTNLFKYIKKLEYNEKISSSLSVPVLNRLRSGISSTLYCDFRYILPHSVDDIVVNLRKIANARRYAMQHGFSPIDFANLVYDINYLFDQYLLKLQYAPVNTVHSYFERYDNIGEIFNDFIDPSILSDNSINSTLYDIYSSFSPTVRQSFHSDPNQFTSVVRKTKHLTELHKKSYKRSKVNNFYYNQLNVNL